MKKMKLIIVFTLVFALNALYGSEESHPYLGADGHDHNKPVYKLEKLIKLLDDEMATLDFLKGFLKKPNWIVQAKNSGLIIQAFAIHPKMDREALLMLFEIAYHENIMSAVTFLMTYLSEMGISEAEIRRSSSVNSLYFLISTTQND